MHGDVMLCFWCRESNPLPCCTSSLLGWRGRTLGQEAFPAANPRAKPCWFCLHWLTRVCSHVCLSVPQCSDWWEWWLGRISAGNGGFCPTEGLLPCSSMS